MKRRILNVVIFLVFCFSINSLVFGSTLEVVNSFSSPAAISRGLAWDGTYLWLCDDGQNKILQLDTSGNIISSFNSPYTEPYGMTHDGTNLWVCDNSADLVYEVTTDGVILSSFPSPGNLYGVGWDGNNLWLTVGDASLYKMTRAGDTLEDYQIGGIAQWSDLAFDDESLWIAHYNGEIAKLNTIGVVLESFNVGGNPIGITWNGNYLWYADDASGMIYQVQVVPGTITSTTTTVDVETTTTTTGTGEIEEFHVSTVAEFQNALEIAGSNGKEDVIWLAAGTYNTLQNKSTFIYSASDNENYGIAIKAESVDSLVILDGNSVYRVLQIEQSITAPVTIDGVTVRNGDGGGIFIPSSGEINLKNNTISNTSNNDGVADDGVAGILARSSGLINIINNTIQGNISNDSAGGIHASSSTNIILSGNTITENTTKNGDGGGVYIGSSKSVTLSDNNIGKNMASSYGGGVYIRATENIILDNNDITENDGGGVYINESKDVVLTNNIVQGNTGGSYSGGGINIFRPLNNIIVEKNIVLENISNSKGGGIQFATTNGVITDNIIAGNEAKEGGGFKIYYSGNVSLTNNTIVGNKASERGGGLFLLSETENAIVNLYNNIIWGNEVADIYQIMSCYVFTYVHNNNFQTIETTLSFTEDVNNIDVDPLFANSEQGDYHLLAGSPCINNGTNDAPELPSTDFEGDSRIIGAAPDMGADEFNPSAPSTTTTVTATTTIPTTTTTIPRMPGNIFSLESSLWSITGGPLNECIGFYGGMIYDCTDYGCESFFPYDQYYYDLFGISIFGVVFTDDEWIRGFTITPLGLGFALLSSQGSSAGVDVLRRVETYWVP